MNVNKQLDEIFDAPVEIVDIREQEENTSLVAPIIVNAPDKEYQKDKDHARQVQYDLIESAQDAINDLMQYAKTAESVPAFDVLSRLIKTASEAAKTLVDISKPDPKDIKKPEPPNVTNTNVFVGSTAELQKTLKELKK